MARAEVILKTGGQRVAPPLLDHAEPPERLSPIAAEFWRDVAPEMTSCGLITPLDATALEMMSECYADWCEARQEMALAGGRYRYRRDTLGNIVSITVHPAVVHLRRAEQSMRMWLDAFGMTPSARLRWEEGDYSAPASAPIDLSQVSREQREALREMIERRLGVGSTRPPENPTTVPVREAEDIAPDA